MPATELLPIVVTSYIDSNNGKSVWMGDKCRRKHLVRLRRCSQRGYGDVDGLHHQRQYRELDQRGGGLFAVTATLTDSVANGNTTAIGGGGLCLTAATLTRSTLSGNTAGTISPPRRR